MTYRCIVIGFKTAFYLLVELDLNYYFALCTQKQQDGKFTSVRFSSVKCAMQYVCVHGWQYI